MQLADRNEISRRTVFVATSRHDLLANDLFRTRRWVEYIPIPTLDVNAWFDREVASNAEEYRRFFLLSGGHPRTMELVQEAIRAGERVDGVYKAVRDQLTTSPHVDAWLPAALFNTKFYDRSVADDANAYPLFINYRDTSMDYHTWFTDSFPPSRLSPIVSLYLFPERGWPSRLARVLFRRAPDTTMFERLYLIYTMTILHVSVGRQYFGHFLLL